MALNRLALRLAAVEALAPHSAHISGEWPTLAEGRVLDTATDRIFDGWDGSQRCFAAVYVEDARRKDRSDNEDSGWDSKDTVNLVVEVVMPAVGLDADGAQIAYAPQSDSDAEAMLDVLEAQIHNRLKWSRMDGILRHVAIRFGTITADPQRDPDLGIRITARRLTYECDIRQQAELPIGATGLNRLPEPLRSVAASLPPGSAGLDTCIKVSEAIGDPSGFSDLELFRIAISLARDPGSAPSPPIVSGEGGDKQAMVEFQ